MLPAGIVLRDLVLPWLARESDPAPDALLPLALRLATTAAPLADGPACLASLHAVVRLLAQRPWSGQAGSLPWDAVQLAREAARCLALVRSSQAVCGCTAA